MIKNIIEKDEKRIAPQVYIVNEFNDIDVIIENLNQGKPVIVNFANMKNRNGYRFIDFLSGYCFAKQGKIKKIDDMIYRFEIITKKIF